MIEHHLEEKRVDCISGLSPEKVPCAFRLRSGSSYYGITFVELLIVLAIIGVLASIGSSAYIGHVRSARINLAIQDIRAISLTVAVYQNDNGSPPDSLADVRQDKRRDPWGNPYQYLNIVTEKGKGKMRKEHFLVPINSDYDLYSMGPDGKSVPPLQAKDSRDDIVRANNGSYVGPAYAY